MQNVFSPMVNMYQTQLEASRRFADAFFSGTEKIDRIVIGATHRAVTEPLRIAQVMSSIRDPRYMGSALQSGVFSRNPDEAVNYQKEIMRIFAEMQNEIGRSMQDCIEQMGSNAASGPAAAAPEFAREQANDAAFNPMTSMFSVWESAFKEVAELAKKNMMAARSAIDNAANNAREGAGTLGVMVGRSMRGTAATAADAMAGAAGSAAKSAASVAEEGGPDDKRGTVVTPGTPAGGGKRK